MNVIHLTPPVMRPVCRRSFTTLQCWEWTLNRSSGYSAVCSQIYLFSFSQCGSRNINGSVSCWSRISKFSSGFFQSCPFPVLKSAYPITGHVYRKIFWLAMWSQTQDLIGYRNWPCPFTNSTKSPHCGFRILQVDFIKPENKLAEIWFGNVLSSVCLAQQKRPCWSKKCTPPPPDTHTNTTPRLSWLSKYLCRNVLFIHSFISHEPGTGVSTWF